MPMLFKGNLKDTLAFITAILLLIIAVFGVIKLPYELLTAKLKFQQTLSELDIEQKSEVIATERLIKLSFITIISIMIGSACLIVLFKIIKKGRDEVGVQDDWRRKFLSPNAIKGINFNKFRKELINVGKDSFEYQQYIIILLQHTPQLKLMLELLKFVSIDTERQSIVAKQELIPELGLALRRAWLFIFEHKQFFLFRTESYNNLLKDLRERVIDVYKLYLDTIIRTLKENENKKQQEKTDPILYEQIKSKIIKENEEAIKLVNKKATCLKEKFSHSRSISKKDLETYFNLFEICATATDVYPCELDHKLLDKTIENILNFYKENKEKSDRCNLLIHMTRKDIITPISKYLSDVILDKFLMEIWILFESMLVLGSENDNLHSPIHQIGANLYDITESFHQRSLDKQPETIKWGNATMAMMSLFLKLNKNEIIRKDYQNFITCSKMISLYRHLKGGNDYREADRIDMEQNMQFSDDGELLQGKIHNISQSGCFASLKENSKPPKSECLKIESADFIKKLCIDMPQWNREASIVKKIQDKGITFLRLVFKEKLTSDIIDSYRDISPLKVFT